MSLDYDIISDIYSCFSVWFNSCEQGQSVHWYLLTVSTAFCAYVNVPPSLFVHVCVCVCCGSVWVSGPLTRTKLAGNHPSSSSIWPHHQSLLEASSTLMTSPALNANSRSAMVTWSHTASALTIEPPLINCTNEGGERGDILCFIPVTWSRSCRN